DILIRASRLKKVMADKEKKSSMETFAPNDKADYYSRITRALWDYWKMGGDEINLNDDESSDLKEY
ncbi:hypothetical protein Tco_1462347, partial [Tanacetum coccineum]